MAVSVNWKALKPNAGNFFTILAESNGSERIGFIQDGTGAVERTAQDKMRETVSVADFGAVGDGVTDDSAAVQAAADYVAAGGGVVNFLPGLTYKINTPIEVTASGVTFDLNGATIDATDLTYDNTVRGSGSVFRFIGAEAAFLTTTLAASAAVGDQTLTLTSATGIQVGDYIRCTSDKVLYSDAATLYAYYSDVNQVTAISGSTVTLRVPLDLDLDISSNTVTVRVAHVITNCRVKGGSLLGGGITETPLANGLGRCGVYFQYAVGCYVEDMDIERFQGIGAITESCYDFQVDDVRLVGIDEGTVIVEGTNSGFYGCYAIRTRAVRMTRLKATRVRHVCDGTEVYGFLQTSNYAEDTHKGAFGTHQGCLDVLVKGNIAKNCETGCVIRFYTGVIEGNILDCINSPITTADMDGTEPGVGRVKIANNELRSRTITTGAISVSGIFDMTVTGNTISNVDGIGISFGNAKIGAIKFMGNDVTAGQGFNIAAASLSDRTFTGPITVQGNDFRDYTTNAVTFRGSDYPSNPLKDVRILHNSGWPRAGASAAGVLLRAEGYYDGDRIEIVGNTQFGDDSATVSVVPGALYRIRSWPIIEQNTEQVVTSRTNRVIGSGTSGSIGTDATLLRGMLIDRANMAQGVPVGYMVVSSGTEGSIAGVTGDISATSNSLTLTGNTSAKVYGGSYISVAGAGAAGATLNSRVTSVSDDFATATLETAASTTVVGAAVTRRNPTVAPLTDVQQAAAGGNVTQGSGSGKATGVTYSSQSGQITLNNAALAANTTVSFTLTNTQILSGSDIVLVAHKSAGTLGAYALSASVSAAGSATVHVRNLTAGSLSEAIVIQFALVRGTA